MEGGNDHRYLYLRVTNSGSCHEHARLTKMENNTLRCECEMCPVGQVYEHVISSCMSLPCFLCHDGLAHPQTVSQNKPSFPKLLGQVFCHSIM